ncbi:hypothetical protein D1007_14906 [Hordeum vulgare]|nr:hypothetical protein D1007_14906 [Hordeum vulgare]
MELNLAASDKEVLQLKDDIQKILPTLADLQVGLSEKTRALSAAADLNADLHVKVRTYEDNLKAAKTKERGPLEELWNEKELLASFVHSSNEHRGQSGSEREDGQLMLTAEQWRARERRRSGARDNDDDGNSVASNIRKNRRGRCYHCDERGHFKRNCPHRRKGPAAEEHALLGDVDVENAGLL